ncbi:MAG: hypothetical protein COV48_05540 [Elusimicrobia bacterium CG11_big_fil_rev_8_21_14_0_20_64_6]|nr:MAG: hypothetical protein COV48_05540 [Elusimicrobia bacterium CG11_big_fil_rev_8_21_14_0_20_64_6]
MNADRDRLLIFIACLLVCAAAERLLPRRARVAPSGRRWLTNLGLMTLGGLAIRLLLPFAAVEAAYRAEAARFGLLNQFMIPFPLKIALTVLLLDLMIYFQHRVFHAVPVLWRLHAVHHTDLDLDASSGVRFHPLEILLSMMIKMAAAALLGAHFMGVVLFEIILNSAAVFNHANIGLPVSVDAVLRLVLVTPDMHRVHHSPSRDETDTNFGFNVPWWDRLFGTYRAQPREPHASMALGLEGSRDPEALGLTPMLARPFKKGA